MAHGAFFHVGQLVQHQEGITGGKTAVGGEGGVVVVHGADKIGELDVSGDQDGRGKDKVEIS